MERYNLFVQTSPDLFQCDTLPSTAPESVISVPSPVCAASSSTIVPSDIHLRRERQTFTPLPAVSASTGRQHVLFTVHTYMVPLTTLSVGELEAVVATARSWSDDMAKYKGRDGWLGATELYLESRRKSSY